MDQPRHRILISASEHDKDWIARLRDELGRALPDVEAVVSSESSPQELPSILDQATAAVVLASPDYLSSPWTSSTELPAILARAREDRLRLLWIPVRGAAWQQSPLAEWQAAIDPGRPLESMSEPERQRAFLVLIESIRSQLGTARHERAPASPVASPPASAAPGFLEEAAAGTAGAPAPAPRAMNATVLAVLSPSSRRALAVADAWRRAGAQDRLHLEHLLMGLYDKQGGPMETRLREAGIRSRGELEVLLRTAGAVLSAPADISPVEAPPLLSDHALAAVNAADELRKRQGSSALHTRQLAWGVLSVSTCRYVQALTARGVVNPEPPPAEAASPTLAAGGLAGYAPDTVEGKDRLDVDREAYRLAMVLAHEDVEPPLSVGLFGDWGSGKSFFMAEIRSWITRLSEQSRRHSGRFCKNVVQLQFNAWHYMDSNLWASLGREIFEGLATAVADKEDPEGARARLFQATESTKDVILATEAALGVRERALEDTTRRLAEVTSAQPPLADVARAAFQAALRQPEVQLPLRAAARELGLDSAGKSVEALKAEIDRLSMLSRWARALAGSLAHRGAGLVVGLALAAIVSLAGYVVLREYRQDLAALVARMIGVLGALTALLGTVGASFARILGRVSSYRDSLEANLAAHREEREAELTGQRARLRAEEKQLRERQEAQAKELESLRNELARLGESRQLIDFIRKRNESNDYRAQLGVVARASQDFRRLSELMERARVARRKRDLGQAYDQEDARLPSVDRIVLYIDDLDRCPEPTVVDVLQAVHLLLAYRLFVVVVAVDPRWLLHSLEEHSRAFRTGGDRNGDGTVDGDGEPPPGEAATWRSTSLDYLEKIFQVPFTLRPMQPRGFTNLVEDLTGDAPPDGVPVAAAGAVLPSPPAASPGATQAASPQAAAAPGALPRESAPLAGAPPAHPPDLQALAAPPETHAPPGAAPTAELDLNPRSLRLERTERDFMARLYDLIPTPRAAKRFVNVYRLIRASIESEEALHQFLDGREYAAVQVLLAMVTGAPAPASEILAALLALPEDQASAMLFWPLLDGLMAAHPGRSEWATLERRLARVRESGEVPERCAPFRKWADDVARYSFYSGRVLLGAQAQGAIPGFPPQTQIVMPLPMPPSEATAPAPGPG